MYLSNLSILPFELESLMLAFTSAVQVLPHMSCNVLLEQGTNRVSNRALWLVEPPPAALSLVESISSCGSAQAGYRAALLLVGDPSPTRSELRVHVVSSSPGILVISRPAHLPGRGSFGKRLIRSRLKIRHGHSFQAGTFAHFRLTPVKAPTKVIFVENPAKLGQFEIFMYLDL